MRLEGLVALVTGGAQGIGAAIGSALHAEGASVVLADIEPADEAAKKLGERAWAVSLDVRDKASVEEAFAAAVGRFGRVDILVNNAARIVTGSVWEISPEEWDDVLAVNARGAFFASQVAGAHMRDNGWGRIVNVTSLAGQAGGLVGGIHYSASKAALIVLTKVFAQALARDGVTVNAIAPAAIESRALEALPEERRQQIADSIPVGRLGRADEVGAAVVYLASREAGYITGATLDLNGGLLMR
jgi:3-oxoacyl-[acyl-carrier protein] reductase